MEIRAPTGNLTTNGYDALDRLSCVNDLASNNPCNVVRYLYDHEGNRVRETDGNGNATKYTYDPLDRLETITDPMDHPPTQLFYDRMGNLVKIIDREGNATTHAYDRVHRRISTTDALANITRFRYDRVGNLSALIDAKKAGEPPGPGTTQYKYDGLNRVITEIYPDAAPNTRRFTYDAVGNVLSRLDQKQQLTAYEYDDLYFLRRRDYAGSDPDDHFTDYDLSGRLLSADRDGWVVTFAYDAANRIVRTTQNGKAVDSRHDIPARQRRVQYPSGRAIVEQTDIRSRLASINDDLIIPGLPAIVRYAYDDGNRVVARTYRNGVAAAYAYNANDWVLSLEHAVPGQPQPLIGFAHEYDNEGNKKFEQKRHDPRDSEAYAYDGNYRLIDYRVGELDVVSSTVPLPATQTTYSLDPIGNWKQKTTDGNIENRSHNTVNEITAIDGKKLAHDHNGNMTDDRSLTFLYDAENRLTRVTRKADGQRLGEYRYDPLGRRVAKLDVVIGVETRFFYDGWRVVEEQNAAGTRQATYVYGNYLDEVLTMERGGRMLYYHQNTLYSVFGLSDAAGALVEGYEYDAYGRQTVFTPGTNGTIDFRGDDMVFAGGSSSLGSPFTFTGRELDSETGLLHYRARAYHTAHARFLQRDPIGYVDGPNLYEYVQGRPTRLTDPSGMVIVARDADERKLWERLAWYACVAITWGAAKADGSVASVAVAPIAGAAARGAAVDPADVCPNCSATLAARLTKIHGEARNVSIGIMPTPGRIKTKTGEINIAKFRDEDANDSAMGRGDTRDSFVEQFLHESVREQEGADRGLRGGSEVPRHTQDKRGLLREWIGQEQLTGMRELGAVSDKQWRDSTAEWTSRDNEARDRAIKAGTQNPTAAQVGAEVWRGIEAARRAEGAKVPGRAPQRRP